MTSASISSAEQSGQNTPTGMDKSGTILLTGIGNEFRSDDGLGLYVAREFRRRLQSGLHVLEHSGEGTALLSSWHGATHVFIVDAIVSGQPSGILYRFDVHSCNIPKGLFRSSSHTFGIVEAIELGRELNKLPRSLIVYGIEGESFEHGVGLSASVVRSVPELIHVIQLDMERLLVDISQI